MSGAVRLVWGDPLMRYVHPLPGYVELVHMLSGPFMVDALDRLEIFKAGFASEDNPIVEDMHQAAATVVGASLVAVEAERRSGRAGLSSPTTWTVARMGTRAE